MLKFNQDLFKVKGINMHFREEYSLPDLEAALEHGIDGDADLVEFSHYDESSEHIRILESMVVDASLLTRYTKGWGIDKSDEEVLKALVKINKTTKSYWAEMLEGFKSKKLPPIIVVNKKLCDGCHRTILCYLFNVPVRVAYFKAPPLDEF